MGLSRPPSDQFPQPTRPTFAAEPGESSDHKSIMKKPAHHTIHHPHVSIDLTKAADHPDPPPPPFYPIIESASSSSSSAGNRAIELSPSTGKTPKGERESVDELLLILVDCLEELSTRSREALLMKFFSEVERDERLEKFIVERLKQSKVKALTDLYDRVPPEIKADAAAAAAVGGEDEMPPMSRSVVESAEELTLKLERFKVKTLDFEGEEEKEQEGNGQSSQDKPTT